MRKVLLGGVALLGGAIALSACHPVEHAHHIGWSMGDHQLWDHHDDTPVTVATRLNCPEDEGDLTRISAAADGKSCQYHGDDDQEVTLSLLALNNQQPQAALAPMETELRGLVPAHTGDSMVNVDAGSGGSNQDHAKIDLPGLHINADGNKADINILGANIKADGDHADIHTDMGMKGTTIHAGPGGAEIRAGDVGRNSAQLVYVLAGDNPGPSGFRAVGYLARGPVGGPLVVGEFKAKEGHQHGHDRDLERLIDLNLIPAGEAR
jgi:hypothetical protein